MNNLHVWSLFEASVGLFAARMDGLPLHGPGSGRHQQPAIFAGPASLSITAEFSGGASSSFDPTAATVPAEQAWSITLEIPDHAVEDALSRMRNHLQPGGLMILTVVHIEENEGLEWTRRQFFYVTATQENRDASGERPATNRRITLRATHMEEDTGTGTPPDTTPAVLGIGEWICGGTRVPCLSYDPATLTWTSLAENATSGETPPLLALGVADDDHPFISLMLPRVQEGGTIQWEATVACYVIGTGVTAASGHLLQTNGTPEPLAHLPQSRLLDEPVAAFRYLRRVYFSIGHGLVCIPRIHTDEPPLTHEPDFRIGGLRFLPHGAYPLPTE